MGQVVETLPAGFSYQGSDLSEFAVAVEGQTVAFTLLGDDRFTYTVAAPSATGVYSFSGVLRDVNKAEEAVAGDSSIRVGPPPTATPEPTHTPTPEPTPHADAGAHAHANAGARRHTPTPEPTHTPTPEPTPTPTPEPTPRPDTGADANADTGAADAHPHAGADGHADPGAADAHPHAHRDAGAHPHVGSPASGPGTRRPATRVDRSARRSGRLGGRRRHSVRPQTSAVGDNPR